MNHQIVFTDKIYTSNFFTRVTKSPLQGRGKGSLSQWITPILQAQCHNFHRRQTFFEESSFVVLNYSLRKTMSRFVCISYRHGTTFLIDLTVLGFQDTCVLGNLVPGKRCTWSEIVEISCYGPRARYIVIITLCTISFAIWDTTHGTCWLL